jgi:hypothetical protein
MGMVCDNSVVIRRTAYHAFTPSTLDGMPINILKWDDSIVNSMNSSALDTY